MRDAAAAKETAAHELALMRRQLSSALAAQAATEKARCCAVPAARFPGLRVSAIPRPELRVGLVEGHCLLCRLNAARLYYSPRLFSQRDELVWVHHDARPGSSSWLDPP
jgi:hypothetical protein